jgi:hypothetical protein
MMKLGPCQQLSTQPGGERGGGRENGREGGRDGGREEDEEWYKKTERNKEDKTLRFDTAVEVLDQMHCENE